MQIGNFRGFEVQLRDPGIALVTFNHPERLNGMRGELKRDLGEILLQAQVDDAVRVVVITGTGRGFSAGDDITGREVDYEGTQQLLPTVIRGERGPMASYGGLRGFSQSLNLAVRSLDKISIAAINGVAIQTGLSLALACDFRIASKEARLGSATLRFGLQPDEGGHALLVQILGVARAMDFLMKNRIVSANEALEMGLVNEVVEHDELMGRTMELATQLANGPQAAMRMLKRAVYNASELTLQQAMDDIATKTAVTDHHPDAREGLAAFREKRTPVFNRPQSS